MADEEQPKDHVPPGDSPPTADKSDIESNVKSRSTWLRLVFMLVIFVIYAVSRFVVLAVVVLQFLWVLFTAETNKQLGELGQSLATFTYQVIRYLSFNSDERPFPFDLEWPPGKEAD